MTNMTNYIEKLLDKNLLANQTLLIDDLLCHQETIVEDDIRNQYHIPEIDEFGNGEEELQDIMQWWLVTEWFADQLDSKGAPIIKSEFGCWWGRTTYGQAVSDDTVIQDIAKELHEAYK